FHRARSPRRSGAFPSEAVLEERIERCDDGSGVLAGAEAGVEALGCRLLERHVAVVARAQPTSFEGPTCVTVEAVDRLVDDAVFPGEPVARLSAGLGIETLLHLGAGNEIGVGDGVVATR